MVESGSTLAFRGVKWVCRCEYGLSRFGGFDDRYDDPRSVEIQKSIQRYHRFVDREVVRVLLDQEMITHPTFTGFR